MNISILVRVIANPVHRTVSALTSFVPLEKFQSFALTVNTSARYLQCDSHKSLKIHSVCVLVPPLRFR